MAKNSRSGNTQRPVQSGIEKRPGYRPLDEGYRPVASAQSAQNAQPAHQPPKPPTGGTGQSAPQNNLPVPAIKVTTDIPDTPRTDLIPIR